MSERTIHLHRVLRCPPQGCTAPSPRPAPWQVVAATRLYPPGASPEARVGGSFRMSFHNLAAAAHTPSRRIPGAGAGELIRYTDQFDDPSLPGFGWR